jgi:hypothetical protein
MYRLVCQFTSVEKVFSAIAMPSPRENRSLLDHTAPGTDPYLEINAYLELDRARDQALHDQALHDIRHGRGDKGFSDVNDDGAGGKLGGGDVSGGNKEMKRTGNRDLDRAREHVLGGRR